MDELKKDLKQAQMDRDEIKVSTLRLLLSEIHNSQIQKGEDLTEEEIIQVIQREVKKRKEAIEGFRSGGREDQARKEEKEAQVLKSYLPAQVSNEELTKLIEDVINNLGAKSLQDLGRVMGEVMKQVGGQADGGRVSSLVRDRLTNRAE